MEQWERELHVAKIIAGKDRVVINGKPIYLLPLTREHKYLASLVYKEEKGRACFEGLLNDEELFEILVYHGLWSQQLEDDNKTLIKGLEDLKVGLFENRLKSNAQFTIRAAIKKTKQELNRLDNIRHGLDYITIEGVALSAKHRYLIGAMIYHEEWSEELWQKPDSLIDKVMEYLATNRLQEEDFRDIARNQPWHSFWESQSHTGRGLFDSASVDLTEDQKQLVWWSTIYDNIRKYPDCPNEETLADDDMLDGWMIMQRRKKESQETAKIEDCITNPKIKNADEQFIFVDTVDDARKVEKLNDPMAALIKKQRMAFLKEKGEVNEVYMPDTAMRIKMELNQLEQAHMRQGK